WRNLHAGGIVCRNDPSAVAKRPLGQPMLEARWIGLCQIQRIPLFLCMNAVIGTIECLVQILAMWVFVHMSRNIVACDDARLGRVARYCGLTTVCHFTLPQADAWRKHA